MVGSRDSISECNVVLNTIAAEVFREACDRLETAEDFDTAVHDLIKEYATEHQRIVFNGNGYAPGMGRGSEETWTSDPSIHGRRDPGTDNRQGCEAL